MDSGASCVAWSPGSATCQLCNLGQGDSSPGLPQFPHLWNGNNSTPTL